MTARPHPNPRSGMMAVESIKTTLTSDPHDLTEIPSLFQTFGQPDASSSEDDVIELMAGTYGAGYIGHGAATTPSATDLDDYAASVDPQRGDQLAGASASLVACSGQRSVSARRSQNNFNRSSHNPYVLLGNSDVDNLAQEKYALASSSRAVRRRRSSYSYSNNTSQNVLMFEFTSTSTGADVGSSSLADSGTVHRSTMQPPQQSQPADAASRGFWREGNQLTLSAAEIRPTTVATVGTLTWSDRAQNLHVNVKQRRRPGNNSTSCSPNTSSMTIPVIQPELPVAVHAPSPSDASIQQTVGAVLSAPHIAASGDWTARKHIPCGPSSKQLGHGCITEPASAAKAADGAEVAGQQKRSGPGSSTYTLSQKASKPENHQHPQELQQHYAYEVPFQPYPLQQQLQQSYGYSGYSSHAYSPVPFQGGYYMQLAALSQKQPYYPSLVPTSSMTIIQGAAGGSPGQAYTEMTYASLPQPARAPYMAGGGTMVGAYGYLQMPPVAQCAGVVPGSFSELQAPSKRRDTRSATTPAQRAQVPATEDADLTPAAPPSGRSTSIKVPWPHADPARVRHQSSKKAFMSASAPSSGPTLESVTKTGKKTAPAVTRAPAAAKATIPPSAKSAKKQDEDRFHVDHDAPVRFFVVVKRKIEGQRYACSFSAKEVPVGSHMLVEGDRGADIGEVLRHVSIEQMARDCALVERLRKRAMERMEFKAGSILNANDSADFDAADLPKLTGEAALEYVMSFKTWPRLIGRATEEDMANLGPQLEAEKQAYATAKPIVQQFIENRYLQRVARNEAALAAAAAAAEASKAVDPAAAVTEESAEPSADHVSTDDGERRRNLTPLSEEELKMLELSREVTLVDCEYQFTREKITLYVSRPSRSIFVDFRSMQRKLFRTFRCRIWIAYMDEVTHDKDAPESFVFVPSLLSPATATKETCNGAKSVGDVA
ncbi:hypothetical protein LSCM1_02591 [Leishmania martiniquensis]|uniref:PSP1 C-terminal domain-containing protein n=1 Tax=Leishmania martiniquensis TaxID=1580590 RepID=A0A836GC38_9TRYP|nr:hypothetical protein LSCM1_02591 [Leishmania martiniquensis]